LERGSFRDILLANNQYHDINPRVCGYERCTPGHAFGPAVRGYYLLHYVQSGCGVFQTPRGESPIHAGQMFIIRPMELTLYRAGGDDPWSYCWIGFDCRIPLPAALKADVADASRCGHIFDAFMLADTLESGRELYLCSKIYELFALLSEPDPSGRGARGGEYVRKACNFIESNYVKEISVAQIARELGLERSYFCHLFRERVGCSPQQYLVQLRLRKAAELIAVHGYSPGQAAASSGYRDIVNFSRMFKRRYGVAPSVYGRPNTDGTESVHKISIDNKNKAE